MRGEVQNRKAISLRSPWWWFILRAGKNIENRDWPTRYRGPVLIHASKWFNVEEVRDDFMDARKIAERCRTMPAATVSLRDLRTPGGCIVGRARIVDCVERSDSPWFFGRYGFVLADAEPLARPIPCKGALGLFGVPASVVEEAADA